MDGDRGDDHAPFVGRRVGSMRRALLIGLALVAMAGCLAASLFGGMAAGDALWPVVWIVWAPVGALILIQRPGNGVGVSLFVTGVVWGIGFWCIAIANSDLPLEVRVWADLIAMLAGVVAWLGIVWLLLIFPSGRLEGRLARLTALGFVVFGALGVFGFTVTTMPLDSTGQLSPMANETLSDLVGWLVGDDGFFVVIGLVGLAIVSAALRWRRSDGLERHQYRWLLLGALVFIGILTLGQFLPDDNPGEYLWLLAGAAIPVSVGVAVTRYRLYEIDRIISRTVSYALVVGLLGGAVALIAAVVGTRFDSPIVVAATTLGVAAVFNPLRRRVQAVVDRRFNRSRYDAERVMNDFADSIRDRADADDVVNGWVSVVARSMEPTRVGVWVRR